MMNLIKTIMDGFWNIFFNQSITIDSYTFKVWVPFAFAIFVALFVKFFGGGDGE